MARTLERRFLGWDAPALPRAAELLARELAPEDLVVLPGRAAARRLEELLAALRPDAAAPARLVTEGALAAALCTVPPVPAPRLALEVAWARALRDGPEDDAVALFGPRPESGDLPAWLALARAALRSLEPLLGAGHDLDEVLRAHSGNATPAERARLGALARAAGAVAGELARAGWSDPSRMARAALASEHLAREGRVWLLALVDLDPERRALLEAFGGDVTALVVAPESEAASFDAWGVVEAGAWRERELPLADEQWTPVAGPAECGALAADWLAELAASEAPPPESITLGVLDAGLSPFVERALGTRGLRLRSAAGIELESTSPARALQAAADWLRLRDFGSLCALVRHPEVEAHLLGASEGALAGALEELDRYGLEHLPWKLEGTWLEGRSSKALLERLAAALEELLGELAGSEARPLSTWAQAAGEFLARLWPALEPARDEQQRDLFESLSACAEALAEGRELAGGPLDPPSLGAAVALGVLVRQLQDRRVAPPPDEHALEAVGWLELALDEAPYVFLAGFDEGSVPAAPAEDSLLPAALRDSLGLDLEQRRVARDAWLTSVLVHGRAAGGLHAVSVRTSHEGEPRRPSRLVFHAPPEVAARRARRAFAGEEPASQAAALEAAEAPPTRRVTSGFTPPTSISVTGFKAYLESPFGFFLDHVLKLERVDDPPAELDPLAFGVLAHDVLDRFGRSELIDSTDPRAIAAELSSTLDRLAAGRYGIEAQPAVRLQLEQLRNRFEGFARWQARTRAEGWRIDAVEFEEPDFALVVDGEACPVRGRIDRMDRHTETGALRVIDYKTGEQGDKPPAPPRQAGQWKDLQLPLYHAMVAPRSAGASIELGYVVIPKERARAGFRPAAYREGHLADALETAHGIVRAVRRGEFEELGRFETQERDPIRRALAGVGLLTGIADGPGDLDGDDDGEGGEA